MEILKTIYTKMNKENIFEEPNAFGLFNILSMNPRNWIALKFIDRYLTYIEPLHSIILMYFKIPKQNDTYFKYIKVEEKETLLDKIHDSIRKYLKYTYHEYTYVKSYINDLIKNNLEQWKIKLAIKDRGQK